MNDQKIRRLAGGFGVGAFVAFLAALPLYFVGVGPGVPLDQTARFSELVARTGTFVIIRTTLADSLIMVGLLVFLAGFRHLIRQARPDYEWVASLVFGVGLVVIALELVADGLEAGAALDTVVRADPTIVRGLMEASFPMYGAIGLIMVGSPTLPRSQTCWSLRRSWAARTSPASTRLPDTRPSSARH